MTNDTDVLNSNAGTARLWIVIPAALLSFVYAGMLEYALPLYFGALETASGGSYPADMWSKLIKYQVTPWLFVPIVAGLLSRRYGERRVWCFSQIAMAVIPWSLIFWPTPIVVIIGALWSGITSALSWTAGVSLIQMVHPEKKGLSNGLMMGSIGVGSIMGPIGGRATLYWPELGKFLYMGEWRHCGRKLLTLEPTNMIPRVDDFLPIFWFLVVITVGAGIMVGLWAQRPGKFAHDDRAPRWERTVMDLKRLAAEVRFWALALTIGILSCGVFQATNQFIPYRAEDVGLKSGAADQGWVWLQLLRTVMLIPGGLAVGLLAGRRAPGIAAVAILGCFTLAGLGIGFSQLAWQLFVCAALFEFMRQFMRWSHTGYLSEHMPDDLRATAIGCMITFAGLGSVGFVWIADYLWNPAMPDFNSSYPFYAGFLCGGIGCVGLFVFDHVCPIRQPEVEVSTAPDVTLDYGSLGEA